MSRKEIRPAGRTAARPAVIRAVGRTAGLIGTAGASMTPVLVGSVADGETEVEMIGPGLATAVLVDVTPVRLVPALLELLGERAWWVPRRLDRRLPHPAPAEH
jgi:RND superfamily putative drug exporter